MRREEGQTVATWGMKMGRRLGDACAAGDLDEVAGLLGAGGANIEARNARGETCLIRAAMHGHAAIATLLLAAGANVEAKCGEGSRSALWRAAEKGSAQCVRVLLEAGADPVGALPMRQSALSQAAELGHVEAMRLLIQAGAPLDGVDAQGFDPLFYAAIHGNTQAAMLLCSAGCSLGRRGGDGPTAAEAARYRGHDEVADALEREVDARAAREESRLIAEAVLDPSRGAISPPRL